MGKNYLIRFRWLLDTIMQRGYISVIDNRHRLFKRRMKRYESLPMEERLAKFRNEVRKAESAIFDIIDGKYGGSIYRMSDNKDDMEIVRHYIGCRYFALCKMFEIHCTDREVEHVKKQNEHLFQLTNDMFSRTGQMFRHLLDMPLDEKDDDIDVEGILRFWGDSEQDVLRLEDDEFYGSDFVRMIPIVAFAEEEDGGLPIMNCFPRWRTGDSLNSSMTDEELGLENSLDDGTSWVEAWLNHPKLQHILFCYATHAIVTHSDFSIPDLIRMNTFEVKVRTDIQQISERDGSRLHWWTKCDEHQLADKFLHEAEHRPEGMTKGEFIWQRVVEYFRFEEMDEQDRRLNESRMRLKEDGKFQVNNMGCFPANRMESLPDCRNDDSQIENFLRKAFKLCH